MVYHIDFKELIISTYTKATLKSVAFFYAVNSTLKKSFIL
ncbi:hypothetical protein T190607A01A_20338 [Tenacibaculum sp. 190524A05c]|uniref:Uncharacterized protein n=1 Tax=Tenacibaculum platacis TaxID=3137852 RepID=A0ABP1ELK1_9FLAO